MPEGFPEFPEIYPVKKRKSASRMVQIQVLILSCRIPETTVTFHESSKYEILSHPLTFLHAGNISDKEECKIPAWARNKCYFWHQQGAFPFPELQFSRGELHFAKFLLKCSYTKIIHF
jgi:hypothetical protein